MNLKAICQELRDQELDLGTRIDIALELGGEDDPEVEKCLIEVAGRSDEDPEVLDSCGESLGEIWARRGEFPEESFRLLASGASEIALATFRALRKQS